MQILLLIFAMKYQCRYHSYSFLSLAYLQPPAQVPLPSQSVLDLVYVGCNHGKFLTVNYVTL